VTGGDAAGVVRCHQLVQQTGSAPDCDAAAVKQLV
jgi:hypothetical protein